MTRASNASTRTSLRRPHTALLAALALLIALAPFSPSLGAEDPPWQVREGYLMSADGTPLRYEAYRNTVSSWSERQPVIVTVSPYLGTQRYFTPYWSDPTTIYGEQTRSRLSGPDGSLALEGGMLAKGYTFVNVTLRGYGGSGGCPDFYGPGELNDVKSAIEWLASQDWSTGRVGIFGMSYPGGTALAALAARPKGLAAAVAMAAPTGWRQMTWTNDIRHAGDFGAYYGQGSLHPPGTGADDAYRESWVQGRAAHPECYPVSSVESTAYDVTTPWWTQREYRNRIAESDVPLLFTQGFYDTNVLPSNLESVLQTRGPRWVWVGQWQHDSPLYWPEGVGRTGFLDQAVRLFDRYVAGTSEEPVGPGAVIQQGDGSWVTAKSWPPKDTTTTALPIRPGSYRDLHQAFGDYNPTQTQGNLSATAVEAAADAVFGPESRRNWTFTEPLDKAVHLAGIPELSLTLRLPASAATMAPGSHGGIDVVVALVDVAADGQLRIINRGTARFFGEQRTFPLLAQDYTVPAGHRLGIGIAGSDFSQRAFDERPMWASYTGVNLVAEPHWHSPGDEVGITSGTLTLPLTSCPHYTATDGGSGRMDAVPTGRLDPTVLAVREVPGSAAIGGQRPRGVGCG